MKSDNSISSDLIRGHIDTIILRSLYDGDKNGNEICLDINGKSGGQYELKLPTLYSALKRLEDAGYIHVFLASAVGQRRKYYKLTDEGRRVCDENFDTWVYSRNIIDKLISDGTDLRYPDYSVKPSRPSIDFSEYENYTFTVDREESFTETDADIGISQATSQEITSEEKPFIKAEDDSDSETKRRALENETSLNNLEDQDELAVTQLSLMGEQNEEDDGRHDEEEQEDTDEEIIIEVSVPVADSAAEENVTQASEEESSTNEAEIEQQDEVIQESSPSAIVLDGDDDSLVLEPYTNRKKQYDDILAMLFPDVNGTAKPQRVPDETAFEDDFRSQSDADEIETPEESPEKPNPVESSAPDAATVLGELPKAEEKIVPQKPLAEKPKNAGEIDYSDIIGMGKMQGIKIKASDRTNKAISGKILINRLVTFSALTLYVIMLIELLALCLSANHILGFSYETILYIAIALAAFPIVCLFILLLAPNRTTNKIPTMRYSVSAAIVVMLNLILLTFAIALLLQIDLFSYYNLFVYILLPIVLYLNIPLYFIIKYLLFSTDMFVREE